MNINPIFKFGFKLVVMAGVNQVLKNIIKTTTPMDIKPMEKIFVNIGSIAISDTISSIIANEVVKNIEDTLGLVKEQGSEKKMVTVVHNHTSEAETEGVVSTKEFMDMINSPEGRNKIRKDIGLPPLPEVFYPKEEIPNAPEEQTTDSSQ